MGIFDRLRGRVPRFKVYSFTSGPDTLVMKARKVGKLSFLGGFDEKHYQVAYLRPDGTYTVHCSDTLGGSTFFHNRTENSIREEFPQLARACGFTKVRQI